MNIDRRKFLKQSSAAGICALGIPSMLSACSGSITRKDLQEKPAAPQAKHGLEARHASILHYASLAPSGHNTQPWVVRIVSPLEWVIGADPARRLPGVDPQNREVMLSLGTFTENLVLAAATFGLEAETTVIADSPFDKDIIKVSLHESTPRKYPLQRITGRMTAKKGYLAKEISSQDIKALSEPLPGRLIYFPRGTSHADCIQEGAIENFRKQTYRQEAQAESVRWFRLSNADAEKHRDGLTVKGMEIHGIKGWYVRNFVKPKDFTKPSFLEQSIDHTARLAHEGGGWIVITSRGSSVSDIIDTGRCFEQVALMARKRMIALHPMTQFLEEKSGLEQIAAHHQTDLLPQFILRVGYLDAYPDPVSLRRPVSWFVT